MAGWSLASVYYFNDFYFSRQLNILDGDNIYSIMASEENIDHLMDMLESAIKVRWFVSLFKGGASK
jgi:hypothetical protein